MTEGVRPEVAHALQVELREAKLEIQRLKAELARELAKDASGSLPTPPDVSEYLYDYEAAPGASSQSMGFMGEAKGTTP